MNSTAQVLRLRDELEARFGSAFLPGGRRPVLESFEGFRTGVTAIDGLLPHGVQRGMLSLWTGDATAGRTAALRALVLHSCAGGARVVVVDTGLTLDATFGCTAAGPIEGLWVVRPPDSSHGEESGWAAEALLRAGVFDLVIVDGGMLEAGQAHRLRALARERNAALVLTAGNRESPPSLRADVRLEFRQGRRTAGEGLLPGGRFRRRVRVVLAKPAVGAPAAGEREVEVVHEPADSLRSHTPAPDRSPGGR